MVLLNKVRLYYEVLVWDTIRQIIPLFRTTFPTPTNASYEDNGKVKSMDSGARKEVSARFEHMSQLNWACQREGIGIESAVGASLLIATANLAKKNLPPKTAVTWPRLLSGLSLLGLMCWGGYLSGARPSKEVKYSASIIALVAGAVAVHYLTEIPEGFCWLRCSAVLPTSPSAPAANKGDRKSMGRAMLCVNIDSTMKFWEVARDYGRHLRSWVSGGLAAYTGTKEGTVTVDACRKTVKTIAAFSFWGDSDTWASAESSGMRELECIDLSIFENADEGMRNVAGLHCLGFAKEKDGMILRLSYCEDRENHGKMEEYLGSIVTALNNSLKCNKEEFW
uniref:Uncharacterized protein n=1 Tax=Fibrocapsa japonica TaxID=94617 RepID=A0A7S2UWQ4_9STRA|mmetsp:Transcript_17404/g.25420  ORF Transcript_17404/g.25420 Transcript_17404/m.25420 type:complete len:337 (+) Transcript_17404:108-1118(+)